MDWSRERIASLVTEDVRQLRDNAFSRGRQAVVALCDEVLQERPKPRAGKRATRGHGGEKRTLVSRSKAFELRGVKLENPRFSWGGTRTVDGAYVLTVWADNIQTEGDTCRYLLWAPNTDGTRPWYDTPGGRERRTHCKAALQRDDTEALLIYGEQGRPDQPINEASKVVGADAGRVIRFKVKQEGDEYWAEWPSASAQP
jgi:hypothetical protein